MALYNYLNVGLILFRKLVYIIFLKLIIYYMEPKLKLWLKFSLLIHREITSGPLTLLIHSLNKYLMNLFYILGPVVYIREKELKRILSSGSFHFSGKDEQLQQSCAAWWSLWKRQAQDAIDNIDKWHLVSLERRKMLIRKENRGKLTQTKETKILKFCCFRKKYCFLVMEICAIRQ